MVLVLALLFFLAMAFGAKDSINKPRCNKDDTWLPHGNTFIYSYTSKASSSFVGTTDSHSRFSFTCRVEINVPRKCEAVMQVTGCLLLESREGINMNYETAETSQEFYRKMSRHATYFQMNRGEILDNSIIIPDGEEESVLNLKRGILSALQVARRRSPEEYSDPINQTDIFGMCSTQYDVVSSSISKLHLRTVRDITQCKVPQMFNMQIRLHSLVKTLQGGTIEEEISEGYYPFTSTVTCDIHGTLFSLKQVDCIQQQAFKPLAYEGVMYSTAMTNISQSLKLEYKTKLTTRHVDRSLTGKKLAGLPFVFEPEIEISISQSDIRNHLDKLVESVISSDVHSWPQRFIEIVEVLRKSDDAVLQQLADELWENSLPPSKQISQRRQFYLDGLLSCGSDACLGTFSVCLEQGHVSGFQGSLYLMDMALTHTPVLKVMKSVLSMCRTKASAKCWLPLGVMISKMAESEVPQKNEVIFMKDAMATLRQIIGDNCKSGILESLLVDKMYETEAKVLLALKTIGNIGIAVQTMHDAHTAKARQLIHAVLQCAEAKHIPASIAKAAIVSLKKMRFTVEIRETLFSILLDINQEADMRTTAFSNLLHDDDGETMQTILDVILDKKQTNNLKSYMESHLEAVLDSDQPDLQSLKNKWKKTIADDGRNFMVSNNYLWGTSKYLDLSRYFRLPLFSELVGLQLEMMAVYSAGSTLFESLVLRANYYYGGMEPLLEIDLDLKGFENILSALLGPKGRGVMSIIHMLREAQMSGASHKAVNFTYFYPDIVTQIVQMMEQANAGALTFPEATFSVKLLGYELGYLSVADIVDLVSGDRPGKDIHPTFLETFLQNLQQGVQFVRTRSSKIIDLVKVIPTISGAPLNMTVLMTYVIEGQANAQADLSQFLRKIGPVVGTGTAMAKGILQFSGEMNIKLLDHISGILMMTTAQMESNVGCRVEYNRGGRAMSHRVGVTITDNMDTQPIKAVRSKIYIIHHRTVETVQSDPRYKITTERCWPELFTMWTGRNLCMRMTYPNVTHSQTHGYFPLSGPFNASVFLEREDSLLSSYNFNILYDVGRTQADVVDMLQINFDAPGENLKRIANFTAELERKIGNVKLELDIPEIQGSAIFELDRNSNDKDYSFSVSAGILSSERLQHGFIIEYDQSKNEMQTNSQLAYMVRFNVTQPDVSMDVGYSTVMNVTSGEDMDMSTSFNLSYYCAKSRPGLYLLHIDPEMAAEHGDLTKIQLTNEMVVKRQSQNWSASDRMQLTYPGQNIVATNDVIANRSYAERETIVTWLNCGGDQETMKILAHVKNETRSEILHYEYVMDVKHKQFEMDLFGYVHGNIKNLQFYSNVSFQAITDQNDELKSSSNQLVPYYMMPTSWNALLNFTMKLVPVLAPNQQRPVGIKFLWHLNMTYPGCPVSYNYFLANGTVGKNLANTINDFKFWYDVNVEIETHNDSSVNTQHGRIANSLQYKQRQLFHFTQDVVFPYGTSDISVLYETSEASGTNLYILVDIQTVWTLLNFYHNESYAIYRGSFVHLVNSTSPFGRLMVSSILKTLQSGITHQLVGNVSSKLPFLIGEVILTTNMTWPFPGLPHLDITAITGDTLQHMELTVISPYRMNITKSHRQGDGEDDFDWSWELSLSGSSILEHTLRWRPDFMREQFTSSVLQLSGFGRCITQAGSTIMANMQKNITDRVIPFTNKTVGFVMMDYFLPQQLPPPTSGGDGIIDTQTDNLQLTPTSRQQIFLGEASTGRMTSMIQAVQDVQNSSAAQAMQMAMSTFLMKFGQWLQSPPAFLQPFMNNMVKPRINGLMHHGELSFVTPLLFKWKSFISFPKPHHAQQYILGLPFLKYWSLQTAGQDIEQKKIAVIRDGQHIYTFDGRIYSIPEGSVAGCTYLLAADLKDKLFALLSTGYGISLLTKYGTVTVDYHDNVFFDDCPIIVDQPTSLSPGLSVSRKGMKIEVDTKFGVTMICDISYKLCSLQLPWQHHNNTLGLFGTNDGEKATDMRTVSGELLSDIPEFISSFIVGSETNCWIREKDDISEECDNDFNHHCTSLFSETNSLLDGCFHTVPVSPFMSSCLEDNTACESRKTDVCDLVATYVHLCAQKGVPVQMPQFPVVDCAVNSSDSSQSGSNNMVVDVVFVVSEHQSMQKNGGPRSHLYNLLDQMVVPNMLIGIVGYGGRGNHIHPHINKFNERHFGFQSQLLSNGVLSLVADGKQYVGAFEAVKLAASFPFRPYSQRIIFLLTTDKAPQQFEDLAAITKLLRDKKIVLNLFSNVAGFGGKRVVGSTYEGMQIHMRKGKGVAIDLPKDDYTNLMKATKGSVLDITAIMGRNRNKIRRIVSHLLIQMVDGSACDGQGTG